MRDIIETKLNEDGIYRANRNSKNVATYGQSEYDWIQGNSHGALGVLKDGDYINDALINISKEISQNSNQLNYQMRTLENSIDRYWNTRVDYRHIKNNKHREYNNLISDQNSLLNSINEKNYPFGLWRYKDDFYYRASSQSELCIGNAEKISKEISSRYPMNVHIVDDLNNIPNNIKEIKFDTVCISKKSIIVIDGEVIEPNQQYEIFHDRDGRFYRNLIVNTEFLKKRFKNYNKNSSESTKTKVFIQQISTYNDAKFLLNRLGKSFESLESENIIVMVGNKNVSEDIFCNRVFKPMIHPENYITITDDILKEKSIPEILRGKLFIYVTHIPENLELRKKLKELLIQVSINKYFYMENQKVNTYAQIIVTLDKEDHFIKDFAHLSSIFYINSLDDILSDINELNDVSLIGNIEASLMNFAEELCAIGNQSNYDYNYINSYPSGNKRFLGELEEVYEVTNLESETNLPILDPYSDDFEKYFPMGDYHTYITGQTRMGKSTLLIILFLRYIQNTNSNVILFDVHGDLAKKAKMLVKDKSRLLYISNTLDKSYAASINLFKIDDKSEKNISKIANLILGVIKQIKTGETFSGAMEELLLRCIRVLLRKGGGSFHELYRFTNDKRNSDLVDYAKKCGDVLDEEYFQDYFNDTNTKNAIRRRLSTLLNDEDFINMMSGDNKLIDFEKEFNTPGKIIIIDIAKGNMDSYIYYIRFIVEYILILALKRFDTPKDKRVITHLILDEFDNFISAKGNIKTILKEAAKYNLLLTIAHQIISDIKDSTLRDTILTMTGAKVIFRNSNTTLDALNKTLNTKLNDVENLDRSIFYLSVENNDIVKMKNTDRFLDSSEEISNEQWEENGQYQLVHNYREIKPKTASQPTEDEIITIIQQFKEDVKSVLSSQKDIESSCLINIGNNSDKLKEVKSDIRYFDTNKNVLRPRIRQQEISTIFKLAFGLNDLIPNRKFISQLKSENVDDIFNQTDSGTRSAEFTDNGKTQTEQYYYLEW